MGAFVYEFEWDPAKAKLDFNKHRLDFERAATMFMDPLALTIPNDRHSETEARWITPGKDATASYALVVHTFERSDDDRVRVRLISARRPTKAGIRNYEEQP